MEGIPVFRTESRYLRNTNTEQFNIVHAHTASMHNIEQFNTVHAHGAQSTAQHSAA